MKSFIIVLALTFVVSASFSQKKSGAKITKEQAIKVVQEQFEDAAIQSSELEKEEGKLIWSFDLKVGGKTQEVWVDAKTGKIIKTEEESAVKEKEEQVSEKVARGKMPTEVVKEEPKKENLWTDSFNLNECNFSSTGKNRYFILTPGYKHILKGAEGKDSITLVITVTNETKTIGKIETRVVEERETINGVIAEVSRNYFAICTQTNSVFHFGEDVDIYKNGEIVSHDGAWRADSGDAHPGLMMPGIILLGAKYYQEIAPDVAMDRAEIILSEKTMQTYAGKFDQCLVTEESTPLQPKSKELKIYAPNIGLIKDGNLLLTSYSR